MAEWRCTIGRPFSVNAMFFTRKDGGRGKAKDYRTWRTMQKQLIMAAGPRPSFKGPVEISIWFGAVGVDPRFDTDNGIKGVLDTLVDMRILANDNRTIVRRLRIDWLMTLDGTEILVKDLENASGSDGQAW